MYNYKAITLSVLTCIWLSANQAYAEDMYGSIKIGGFLPNGSGNSASHSGGLKDFDTGFNLEASFGTYVAPYAALEASTGFYSSSRKINDAAYQEESKIYGVPVSLTIKGLISTEKADFYAGAGAGYYFTLLDKNSHFTNASTSQSVSTHSNALGYHLVGGTDFKMNDLWSVGAEIKWFSTRPKFEDDGGNKVEWEFGGTTLNLTAKYRF